VSARPLFLPPDGHPRCPWCAASPGDALYLRYHDEEWGFPVVDEARLFEKLCLEGFQSGLSWRTILHKREGFRRAFEGFDVHRLAGWGEAEVLRLLQDEGIVRHRGKIEATLNNAARCVELVAEVGSLAAYVWRFEPEPGEAVHQLNESGPSRRLSSDLKRRGWKFVGPTTMHAFLQAMGLINDHDRRCSVYPAAEAARRAFQRPVHLP
jgi:DNA-3-methyladenine glycosylase I